MATIRCDLQFLDICNAWKIIKYTSNHERKSGNSVGWDDPCRILYFSGSCDFDLYNTWIHGPKTMSTYVFRFNGRKIEEGMKTAIMAAGRGAMMTDEILEKLK